MRRLAFGQIALLFLCCTAVIGFTAFFEPPGSTNSGIHTEGGFAVETLVNDIFVAGGCNNISNISAIGNPGGIGYFENGSSSIGLNKGIILSTGPIQFAEGPNDVTDASGNFEDNSGDIDLNTMAVDVVRDAVGLSFDFVPLDSFVSFHYVFASEEYCEFVGSNYNDVFGFFISGPGINGPFSDNAQNVALIPGTDNAVTINSVNHINNSSYYIGNELPDDALECNFAYQPSANRPLIEYDGFTKKLTAVLKLTPCETYHIRLVVADVGDNFYDSAVFLEANSFNIGGAVSLNAVAAGNPDLIVFEGCPEAYFVFERVQTDYINFPINVDFFVSDLSLAVSGIDFMPLPTSITIPAGQLSVNLPVVTINDQETEPIEQLILELDIPCACYSDTASLFLQDSPMLTLELPDVPVCENNSTIVEPTVSGGIPPYTYLWSDQSDEAIFSIFPQDPGLFSLTVTDACSSIIIDTAEILVVEPPEAFLSGEVKLCEGDTTFLPVQFSGVPPFEIWYQIDGNAQFLQQNIMDSLFELPVTLGGQYEIVEFSDAACAGEFGGIGQVEMTQITVVSTIHPVHCFDGADGAIEAQITGGIPPYQYEWLEDIGDTLNPDQLTAGIYHLWVQDEQGCQKEVALEVPSPAPLELLGLDCEDFYLEELNLEATGGTPPYLYTVDGQNFVDQSLFDELEVGESYNLTILDANDCRTETDLLMPALYQRMVDLPTEKRVKFGEEHQIVPLLNIPESLVANIRWVPDHNLSCADCLEPVHTALENEVYSLRIINQFGCRDDIDIAIIIDPGVDVYLPSAFSPNGDEINDYFVVYANDVQVEKVLSFRIFDRWGGLMFEEKDFPPNESQYGWDGSFRGQQMDAGVYVYFVQLQLSNGNQEILEGSVALLK